MLTNEEKYEEALKLIAQDTKESLEKGLAILKELPEGFKDSKNIISEVAVKIEANKNQKVTNNVIRYGGILLVIHT